MPPIWRNRIVVVTGLPRSGTSLMMQMLDRGGVPILTDQVREADVDNPRGYYEYEPVKRLRKDTSFLAGGVGKAVKMVYVLLYDLPGEYEYCVIFMRRRLEEVLASQRKMLERLDQAGAKMTDEQLIAAYEQQLAKADEWLEQRPNMAVRDVRYDQVLQAPAEQAESIDQFLGGGLNVEAMAAAVDPTLYRQRK